MSSQPTHTDAVLGGNSPLATFAVLGGQGKYLVLLFDLFNGKAKQCNKGYLQFKFSVELNERFEEIALVGAIKRQPLDTLKIKVKQALPGHKGEPYIYWEFAGYVKHDGVLFTPHTATYDPAKCDADLRCIAYAALISKAREIAGVNHLPLTVGEKFTRTSGGAA